MSSIEEIQNFLYTKQKDLFSSMYGKNFNSPQQVKEIKKPDYKPSRMLCSSQSQRQLQGKQPANMPSKYANSSVGMNNNDQRSEQQLSSRPQSEYMHKSQSQANFNPMQYKQQQKQAVPKQSQLAAQRYQSNQYQSGPSQRPRPQSQYLKRAAQKNPDEYSRNSKQKQYFQQSNYQGKVPLQNYQDPDTLSRASQSQSQLTPSYQAFDQLQTKQFLKTNLEEYLKPDQDRCISCSECMKGQDKNLFYKYPKGLKTLYEQEFSKFDPNAKSKIFNLDQERLNFKVPYKVQRDFVSTNKAVYQPFEVQYQPKKQDQGLNNEIDNPCFIGSTTYNQTYQNWGANPAMKPAKQQPHFINMKIKDSTAYKEAYSSGKEGIPLFMREHEAILKKSCIDKMRKGSLNRFVDAPFQGQSVAHQTFVDPHGKSKNELFKPIDEVIYFKLTLLQLFVAKLPMKTDSINHTEYNAKKVDRCKYIVNKQKPIFD